MRLKSRRFWRHIHLKYFQKMVTTFLDSQNITSIELYNLLFFKLHEAERRYLLTEILRARKFIITKEELQYIDVGFLT